MSVTFSGVSVPRSKYVGYIIRGDSMHAYTSVVNPTEGYPRMAGV